MKFDKETAAYKKKRVVYLENKKDIWQVKKEDAKKAAIKEGEEWNDEDYEKLEDSDSGDDAGEETKTNPKPKTPKPLEERLTEIEEFLVAQWESDKDQVAGWYDSFREEAKIPCQIIKAERDEQSIFNLLNFHLNPYLGKRENLLERFQLFSPHQKFLPHFENNYCYQKSKYRSTNALKLELLPKQRQYPLIYRNKIFYFDSIKEL